MTRTIFPPLTCASAKCKTTDPHATRHCPHCAHTIRERELYLRAFAEAAVAR
jgi:hypothetical protein